MSEKNICVTGPPGCGKSTFIEKVIRQIESPITGFFTREIKERGHRVGFSIITVAGKKGILAHENVKNAIRVGRYGVNLADIDKIAVPSMLPAQPDEIVVIDEIGKMECFSPLFKKTLIQILDSRHWVIGSIALKGDHFIETIKERKDLMLINLCKENRDQPNLISSLLAQIKHKVTGG